MGRPTITPEIAFTSNPLDAVQNFIPISTKYPFTCSIQRGRNSILDRIEAGTMRLRLWDGDKLFDPINTASPYYSNVRPRKQIRIGASNIYGYSGTKYLFTGFIERVQPVYEKGERWVDITAVDAFKYLAKAQIDLTRGVEGSGSRINKVFDALGWPVDNRNIPGGDSQVTAVTITNASPLQHIQDATTSENGLFFFNGDGKAIYHNRYFRLKQYNSVNSCGTFDQMGIALPCTPRTSHDDTLLANRVLTTQGGTTIGYRQDMTSQSAYMLSVLSRELPILVPISEGQDAAGWLLNQRKDLTFRVDSAMLDADAGQSVENHMFLREISDRVTIKIYPNNNKNATPWQLDHYIEGANWDFRRDSYTASWPLSPADTNNYIVIGDAIRGRADFDKAAY